MIDYGPAVLNTVLIKNKTSEVHMKRANALLQIVQIACLGKPSITVLVRCCNLVTYQLLAASRCAHMAAHLDCHAIQLSPGTTLPANKSAPLFIDIF